MTEHDKRFAALALTLKYDGLKLLCMIRLCPLPYSFCNGAVSTFPTVQPLSYGLATLIVAPKFMVPAFIGSRIRILSENNEEMSAGSKAINIISIIVSVSIGVATGIYIYRRYVFFASIDIQGIYLTCAEHWPARKNSKPKNGLESDGLYRKITLQDALMVTFQTTPTPMRRPRLWLVMRKHGLDSMTRTTSTSMLKEMNWPKAAVIDHTATSSPIMILMSLMTVMVMSRIHMDCILT